MSHHVDSAAARADGRVDLCDLYVFDGADPNTTVLIMTVNPDAGRSSPTTFHPQATYAFHVDTNQDAKADLTFLIRFGEPDAAGEQALTLLRHEANVPGQNAEGEVIGTGTTNTDITLPGGGRLWAGLAGDPFFGNGIGLETFKQAIQTEQRFDPALFSQGGNIFARRNVTGIVLQVPNAALATEVISIWQTTTLADHGASAQINREATPLLTHLFIPDEHLRDHYNTGQPQDDMALLADHVAAWVSQIASLAGTVVDVQAYGQRVAATLLPDMLRYRLGTPAGYSFLERNGRRLTDDAMSVVLTLASNFPLAAQAPRSTEYRTTFPYLPLPFALSEALPPLNRRQP